MRDGEEAPTWLIPTDTLSHEDKNGAIFRYVAFFLGYEMMDKIQEPSDAKCSVELAEPFRTDEKSKLSQSCVWGSSCEEEWHLKALENNVGTVPWFRRFVAVLSPQRPEFSPRTMLLGFVVTKWELDRFCSEHFGFPLSVSLQRCSLFILSSITAVM